MLDDEFFRTHPISIYHGIHHQEGSVVALFFNPRVSDKIYALSEKGLHDGISNALKHQRICPIDNWNATELQVKKRALWEVQEEKVRCGMPLDAPRPTGRGYMTVLSCTPLPA